VRKIEVGEYIDIPLFQGIRVIAKDIVEDELPTGRLFVTQEKQWAAKFEIREPWYFSVGTGIKQLSEYEFLIQVTEGSTQEFRSLYFFRISDELVLLFRIFVSHINLRTRTIEVDYGSFRYEDT
jgi:hypothetical protein